jgi:ribosomal protein S18 acetylase RimI-like enzyme
MEIRKAGLSDAVILAALGSQTFIETFEYYKGHSIERRYEPEDLKLYIETVFSIGQMQVELASQANQFYIAEQDAEPLGYFKLSTAKTLEELAGKRAIQLERIYVKEAFTSHGYGRELMNAALAQAKLQGYTALWLGVWEHNIRALRFYNKVGFVVFGSHLFTVGTAVDTDLLMGLDL